MQGDRFIGPLGALRRKLRALAAVAGDVGATASERANAEALKDRLEERIRATEVRTPAGDWTDHAFRLGQWTKAQWAKGMQQSAATPISKGDLTGNARRLGKAVRRGYKKWLSD